MPQFAYTAVDGSGNQEDAQLEAASEGDALRMLKARRLAVIDLRAARTDFAAKTQGGQPAPEHVSTAVPMPLVLSLYEQINFFFTAGIPIHLCIRMTIDIIKQPVLIKILKRVLYELSEGVAFSTALGRFPRCFPPVHVQIIGIGEKTGKLDKALIQLVELMRERMDISAKAMKAAAYPVFLVGVSLTLGLAMIFFVFPKFQDIFTSFGVKLPPLTQFLMNLNQDVRDNAVTVFGIPLAMGITIFALKRHPMVAQLKEWLLLNVPLLKDIYMSMFMSLFSKTMASLLRSGTPLLDSLIVFRETLPEGKRQEFFDTIISGVREGESVSAVIRRTGFVPDLVWQLIAVGEKTGDMAVIMEKLFLYYKTKYSEKLAVITGILQPLFMLAAAGFIGIIAVALFVPLFKLGSSMRAN